ncbi:U3 small nucleolar RNA-associated protein 6 homolog [Latimeria chalumnae]|uniref:UTP6 small subunit processome component n=1 Tax=Latimeria chalumnae TaxID=7897 RepID=H3BC90_LATCH|nr:PREDICTED: U3 small nucleolar RNA-associated protein 6 homolog [Latimeria chalumnae]|eukprot:XP_005993819.1 PREDICTED: U3 small nucleolar RNA-associated protein 6 homolog [Latimeria chalumnae]
MAEIIQQRIEDRIPELEQLERVGLFSRKEIKTVIKKASALEYKLYRRIISKEDLINYIQYEINLLELIKKRRLRIGYTFKKEEIEYSIVQRINNVFKRATAKWKDDVQLWLSHIAFCKKWNTKTQLSKAFSAMLAIHPDKPALWIMAAKWEMEDRMSSESARHLFLRALRFHPESQKLYQEYFRMELMHAEKLQKEKRELEKAKMDLGDYEFPEEIIKGELARIVYKDAVQKIKGAELHLSFLSIARLFDCTQELQKEILDDLQTLHASDPLTWDYMARQELEVELASFSEYASKQTKASDIAQKEERCYVVYEEAVSSLPTEAMWKYYIAFCLERLKRKTNNKELKQKRQERVLAVFNKAHESNLLSEALFKEWLQLLLGLNQSEKAADVAVVATRCFSQSVEMWQASLKVLIELKRDDVCKMFEEAFSQIKTKESLPLWTLLVEWNEGMNRPEETEAAFQRAIHSPIPIISVTMKEKYLDWAFRTGGYKKAKKVFTSLHESRPFSLDFFRKMIQIEKEQEPSKMQNLREYYERALREFGSTDADLWLDYIKEEIGHTQGKPENSGKIHWRAMKMLEGEQVEYFISKYTLLQTGHL